MCRPGFLRIGFPAIASRKMSIHEKCVGLAKVFTKSETWIAPYSGGTKAVSIKPKWKMSSHKKDVHSPC